MVMDLKAKEAKRAARIKAKEDMLNAENAQANAESADAPELTAPEESQDTEEKK